MQQLLPSPHSKKVASFILCGVKFWHECECNWLPVSTWLGTCPGSSQRKLGKTQASSAGKEGGGKKQKQGYFLLFAFSIILHSTL